MRLRQQLAQIRIARPILHEHRQNAAVFHAQFRADDRPDILFAGGGGKSLRAIDAVAIEQRQRGHLEPGDGFSQLLGERRAAQKAERAARM